MKIEDIPPQFNWDKALDHLQMDISAASCKQGIIYKEKTNNNILNLIDKLLD